MPKIRIWTRIDDLGDGSSSTSLFATEAEARKGYDEEGFNIKYSDVPSEFESVDFDASQCEVIED